MHEATAFGIIDKNVTTTVTVKVFKHRVNTDFHRTQAFISEFKSLLEVGSHLNIIDLLGTCFRRKTDGDKLFFFFNIFDSKPSLYL